jgi:hypothetical protein
MGESDKVIVTALGTVLKDRFARYETGVNERLARFEKAKPAVMDNSLVAQALQQVAAAMKEQSGILAGILKLMKERKPRKYKINHGDESSTLTED